MSRSGNANLFDVAAPDTPEFRAAKAWAEKLAAGYFEHVRRKYEEPREKRRENEVFVHEVLQRVFEFEPSEDEHAVKMLVGEAWDEFVRQHVCECGIVSAEFRVGGKTYRLTGSPDSAAADPKTGEVVPVETKFSDRLRPYHALQAAIYAALSRSKFALVACVSREALRIYAVPALSEFAVHALLAAYIYSDDYVLRAFAAVAERLARDARLVLELRAVRRPSSGEDGRASS